MSRKRVAAAAFLLASFAVGTWSLGRSYRDQRAVEDARQALEDLSRMQRAYRRLEGAYTEDLSALADMTKDWRGFMESLDVILDLRAGFAMSIERDGYRISAHARDRKSSRVVLEGPPKTMIAEGSDRRTGALSATSASTNPVRTAPR